MHLHNLPLENRPREKALKYGISTLSDQELIALLIGSGCKDFNVLEVANELLFKAHGISNLIHFQDEDLMKIKGIKKVKAIRFLASIELTKRIRINSIESTYYVDFIANYCDRLRDEEQEHLYVIGVDNKKNFKKEFLVSKSNSDGILISIKEILRLSMKLSTKYVCLIHNHPSGNVNPSDEDKYATNLISKELARFGVILLDHFIISGEKVYSIKQEKII